MKTDPDPILKEALEENLRAIVNKKEVSLPSSAILVSLVLFVPPNEYLEFPSYLKTLLAPFPLSISNFLAS